MSDRGEAVKPKRKTREKILDAALELFNRYGEPNVTASLIAADVGISHGNLYYHYPSKEKIVEDLFEAFSLEIEHTLQTPRSRPTHPEDVWLFLHLMFEAIFKYRFLYRDLNELLSCHRVIETQFRPIIEHQIGTAKALLAGLVAAGDMRATPAEIDRLAENITIIATYWLSYDFVLNPRVQPGSATLTRGAAHILSLAAPYLQPQARTLFDHLARQYSKLGGNPHGSEEVELEKLSP